MTLVGILGFAAAIVVGINDSDSCTETSGTIALISVVAWLVGALLVGGGWAYAIRATWVVLATLATLDVSIFYLNLLVGLDDSAAVQGLLLLAFAIHAICISVAARWSFTAMDMGPIERAKAGEAGQTLMRSGCSWRPTPGCRCFARRAACSVPLPVRRSDSGRLSRDHGQRLHQVRRGRSCQTRWSAPIRSSPQEPQSEASGAAVVRGGSFADGRGEE